MSIELAYPGDKGPRFGLTVANILKPWQPEQSLRRWMTDAQWSGIVRGDLTGHLSVELQEAEDEMHDNGGGTILYPAGLIPVDGYKGASNAFDIYRRGGLLLRGGVHHRGVPGKTIWRNVADQWRCMVSVKNPETFSFFGITFDGDWRNRPPALLAQDDIRGDGFNFWGSLAGAVKRASIRQCTFLHMGHYAIGVQSDIIQDLWIEDCYGEDIGGDFIDIKDFPTTTPKINIRITGNTANGIGTNWRARVADNDGPQAGFDIRGACQVSNNVVMNLTSYDPSQVGNDGLRVNADVDGAPDRKGGARSILINNRVTGSKLDSEGSNTSKRIRGLVVQDENVIVVGHYSKNCFIGTLVANAGDSIADRATLLGIVNENCKGEAGDGLGIRLGAMTSEHSIDVKNINCDIGFSCDAQNSRGSIDNIGCTLGTDVGTDILLSNQLQFLNAGNLTNSSVPSALNNFKNELTLWAQTSAWVNIRSTLDSNAWPAPYGSGGVRWMKEDTSGLGPGIAAMIEQRFAGPSAVNSGLFLVVNDGTTGLIDAMSFGFSFNRSKLPLIQTTALITLQDVGEFGAELTSDRLITYKGKGSDGNVRIGAIHLNPYTTVATDADFTVIYGNSAHNIRHTGTLTANRTVTLSTVGATNGASFRITRTGTGAFTLGIGGLKALATNTWCEVVYDGVAWYLSAYGSL